MSDDEERDTRGKFERTRSPQERRRSRSPALERARARLPSRGGATTRAGQSDPAWTTHRRPRCLLPSCRLIFRLVRSRRSAWKCRCGTPSSSSLRRPSSRYLTASSAGIFWRWVHATCLRTMLRTDRGGQSVALLSSFLAPTTIGRLPSCRYVCCRSFLLYLVLVVLVEYYYGSSRVLVLRTIE